MSIEDTAKKLGIKLTTAKAIYKVYLKEGRTSKKKFKEKKPIQNLDLLFNRKSIDFVKNLNDVPKIDSKNIFSSY